MICANGHNHPQKSGAEACDTMSEALRNFGLPIKDDSAALLNKVKELELQNAEMKKILRLIVDPILKADEEKEPDKHAFCRCVFCRAWNIYENEPAVEQNDEAGHVYGSCSRVPCPICKRIEDEVRG